MVMYLVMLTLCAKIYRKVAGCGHFDYSCSRISCFCELQLASTGFSSHGVSVRVFELRQSTDRRLRENAITENLKLGAFPYRKFRSESSFALRYVSLGFR